MRRYALLGLLVAVPAAILVFLRAVPQLDLEFFNAQAHLFVVGGIAACALVTALIAAATAARSGQPGAVWLGIGCTAVGVFMLGHGLMTPGQFGRNPNQWVGRFPHLAMAVFATCLLMAGRPASHTVNRLITARPRAGLVTAITPMLVLLVTVLIDGQFLATEARRSLEENAFDVVSIVSVVMLAIAMIVHWRRWQLGRDVVQLAIVLAAGASIAAITAFQHGQMRRLSWWDYHGYLLAGFGAAVYAVFARRASQRRVTDVLEHALADDPFSLIEHGYPEALRSLVRAVELKDAYTHGHSERTARVAVELGMKLRLPPDQLRVVARGACLHDLGKIAIPDHILNKPGPLTPEERTVIETHPQLGYEMAAKAASLREALSVILHHHERFDGTGYPRGLAGTDIPIEARVVAVADVWDALTSDRSYRKGWTPSEALAHIEAGAGSHFDHRVVRAFSELAAEWGVRAAAHGQAELAWQAAETCHEIDSIEPSPVPA